MISPDPPPRECDVAVVGGGILGLAVAREVLRRRPIARLCVLEAEDRLGLHQTGHSSGVLHAGIYYTPGSLKAKLCVEGARLMGDFCERNSIRLVRNGKLILATAEQDLPRLDELERRGISNGVPDLRRIGPDEITEIEPNARGLAALHSPQTGVVDFAAVTRAMAQEVAAGEGSVHTRSPVTKTGVTQGRVVLHHPAGTTKASAAIFCAGLWADRLAIAAGAPEDPRIVPFRGAYSRLAPQRVGLVRGNIYPVPDPDLPFLGTHFTHHPGPVGADGKAGPGSTLVGPTALLAPARDAYRLSRIRPLDLLESLRWKGTRRMMRRHWRAGGRELHLAARQGAVAEEAARMVPSLRTGDLMRGPAGIRAQAVGKDGRLIDDFVVHLTERAIHVRNAPSPAATSSLALARLIVDRLTDLD